jgi:hypothetical protein
VEVGGNDKVLSVGLMKVGLIFGMILIITAGAMAEEIRLIVTGMGSGLHKCFYELRVTR